jgi:hypothetical protein
VLLTRNKLLGFESSTAHLLLTAVPETKLLASSLSLPLMPDETSTPSFGASPIQPPPVPNRPVLLIVNNSNGGQRLHAKGAGKNEKVSCIQSAGAGSRLVAPWDWSSSPPG